MEADYDSQSEKGFSPLPYRCGRRKIDISAFMSTGRRNRRPPPRRIYPSLNQPIVFSGPLCEQ